MKGQPHLKIPWTCSGTLPNKSLRIINCELIILRPHIHIFFAVENKILNHKTKKQTEQAASRMG